MNTQFKKKILQAGKSITTKCQKHILIKLHLLWISIFMMNFAAAIPPTPPLELLFQAPAEINSLEPKNGRFILPLRIDANRYVEAPKLIVRTKKTGMQTPPRGQIRHYSIHALQKGDKHLMRIKLPVQTGQGIYRIELSLEMNQSKQAETVSKLVLIQQVSPGQAKLMTPAGLRRGQVEAGNQAFWKTLAKKRPDIKKLTGKLQPVNKTASRRVRLKSTADHKNAEASDLPEMIKPYLLNKSGVQRQTLAATGLPPLPTQVKGEVVFEDFYTDLTCNPYDVNDPNYPCTDPLLPVLTPLANATVVLLVDEPSGFDFSLGSTVTNEDGEWAVDIDPSFLGSDFYYMVNLDNTEFTVRDDTGTAYIWTSDTLPAGPGPLFPNIVNFGQQTMTDNIEAAQVFNVMNTGWNHIVNEGGADPLNLDKLEVRYPDHCIVNSLPTSCWDVSAEIVKIEADVNDGPDVILHEYGHALQFYAFGGNPVAGGSHSFDDVTQDSGVAYGEGWATAFSMSVCPDEYFSWAEGPYEGPDEWPACNENIDYGEWIEGFRYPTASANRDGEHHEGRVAAALLDFMDESNDDNAGTESRGKNNYEDANENDLISMETIFGDHMWGYDFNDFINYFIHLRTGLSTVEQQLADDIMTYNWMSWPITAPWPPTLCVASKVAMALSPDYAQVLKGLRLFRDRLMKPLVDGRDWIQSYYSHSPEIAILLIKNPQSRKAAKVLVEHFSRVGYRLSEPGGLDLLAQSQERVLPQSVLKSIDTISKVINDNGSRDLRLKLAELRAFIRPFSTLSMSQAVNQLDSMAKVEPGKHAMSIAPLNFAPASKIADWELIYQHIPESERP